MFKTILTVGIVGVGAWIGYNWYKGYQAKQLLATQQVASQSASQSAIDQLNFRTANCPPGVICGAPGGVRVL